MEQQNIATPKTSPASDRQARRHSFTGPMAQVDATFERAKDACRQISPSVKHFEQHGSNTPQK